MKFYQQQRRAAPAIPVVSLIDVMSILLIFCIISMSFPEKKSHLTISLPKATAALSGVTTSTAVERRVTVALKDKDGVLVGDQPVALPDLGKALVKLKSENPGVKLDLMADENLPLGTLVSVWDAFNQAGIAIKDVPARIQLQKGP